MPPHSPLRGNLKRDTSKKKKKKNTANDLGIKLNS